MKQILIVDDDMYIGDMLREVLEREGYGILRAYSGTEALLVLENRKPDLILLDLMLPGLSGEKLLPRIKDIPIIVVSAKAEISNKVELLLAGAADYVTKPFDVRELLARIVAALRKRESICNVLCHGDLHLDVTSHDVQVRNTPVRLTRTEYAILKLLLQNPGQVLAKSVLLDRISIDTPDCTESSLKQHMSNLRKKLREAGGKEYIEAVWGIGFKLS